MGSQGINHDWATDTFTLPFLRLAQVRGVHTGVPRGLGSTCNSPTLPGVALDFHLLNKHPSDKDTPSLPSTRRARPGGPGKNEGRCHHGRLGLQFPLSWPWSMQGTTSRVVRLAQSGWRSGKKGGGWWWAGLGSGELVPLQETAHRVQRFTFFAFFWLAGF